MISRAPLLTLLFCFLLSSCNLGREKTAEQVITETFITAFNDLQRHDYDAYLRACDMGEEPDSFQIAFMQNVLAQHQDWQEVRKGAAIDVLVIDTEMLGDTVCYVYYEVAFADSTREVSSQKMVRTEGDWKLRLRN